MWVLKWDNFKLMNKKVDSKYIQVSLWNHFLFHWIYYKLNRNCEKIWNNKCKKNLLLKWISQYGVQNYFIIRKKLNKHVVQKLKYECHCVFKQWIEKKKKKKKY